MDIQEIRQKFPQYSDISDGDLVGAIHKKFYSDIPYQDFEKKVFNTTPAKVGVEGLPGAIGDVSKDFSGLSKAAIGAAGAVNKAAMRLKQITGQDLTPQDLQGLEEYKALEKASGAAIAGEIGMNILATINPATKLYGAGKAAAERVLPQAAKVLAPTAGAAVAGAGITAATNPVQQGETEAGNIGLGTAGAVAADTLTRGASRVLRPIVQSEAVQKLVKEGIIPTIGQAVGGLANKVEQKLESIPVIGWAITGGRDRATKEMNEAAIRKALPAASSPEAIQAGRAGIEKAGEVIDGAYDAAYAAIKGKVKVDDAFNEKISQIAKREGIDLPESMADRFDKLIKDRVTDRLSEGASAETIRQVHNSLGALSRKYKGSGDPDQRALGQAFAEAKAELRSLVSRESGGEFKQALDALDKKYAALLTVEKASGYAGSKEGVFSADALKRASAKSSAEMKEFSRNAADVMGSSVPDSGTAGRVMNAIAPYVISGGIAGGNESLGGPAWLTAAAAAPIMYSKFGARYALGDLPFQQALAEALRRSSAQTSNIGRSVLLEQK